jgi:hypothetical protein
MTYNRITKEQTGRKSKERRREKKGLLSIFGRKTEEEKKQF